MLRVLDVNNKEWNDLVKSFKNYGVHYLNEYVLAFKNHGDGEPLLFYYEGNNTRGINVVMRRCINDVDDFSNIEDKYYDLFTPYGYGGWIFEGEETKDAYDEYIKWCLDNNIICEFVRFNLFDRREDYYGDVIPRVMNVVRNLEDDIENIQKDYERRVRKDLKKTNDLKLIVDDKGEYLDDFLRIYYSTMDRNNAEDEYYFDRDFYNQIDKMNGNFTYFHVLLEDKIVSTELVIMDNNNMYSYLGGTDRDYYSYHPNHFIKDEIIKWGVNNHYKNFVLGGGYGSDDGIFLFKKGFSPNGLIQFYTGQKIFNEDMYNKLVNIKVNKGLNIEGNKYFPLYRAK